MQREKHKKIMKNDTHHSHAKCEFPKILEGCIRRFARQPRLGCKLQWQIAKGAKRTEREEGMDAKVRSLSAKVKQKEATTTNNTAGGHRRLPRRDARKCKK